MKLRVTLVLLGACALLAIPGRARSQDWRPPSSQMPEMPGRAEAQGAAQGSWGASMARAARVSADGVRAAGEGGGAHARFVRFTSGVYPVATWSDRNGDGRCDMVEVFNDGNRIYQLIDADYDGTANVLRVYSPSGELVREERL